MTREDAIKIFKGFKFLPREMKAVDMAIKALEQEPILDKIRAEIEKLRIHKAQFLTSDGKVCIDSQAVLDILDKYKAESEDEK